MATKEQLRRNAQNTIEWLNEEFSVIPLLTKIQNFTGIPASLQAVLMLVYLVYQAFTGGFANEIAILVGTVYPALKSIRALQTDTDPEDDKTWLTYWMCYGCLVVADMHVGWVLTIIPFYYLFKLGLLIWLQLPLGPLMGAKIVYRCFLQPLFRFIGPAINDFAARHADDVYAMQFDVNAGMEDIKKQAMKAGTTMFLEQAMEKMAEEHSTAKSAEKKTKIE